MGYIYTFIGIMVVIVTIALHKLLIGLWRTIKKDRLLDDTQALREYENVHNPPLLFKYFNIMN